MGRFASWVRRICCFRFRRTGCCVFARRRRLSFAAKTASPYAIRCCTLDKLTVDVNPDDLETAIHVILVKSGSSSDRESVSAPADEARITVPEASDFGRAHSVTETNAGDNPREPRSSGDSADAPAAEKTGRGTMTPSKLSSAMPGPPQLRFRRAFPISSSSR